MGTYTTNNYFYKPSLGASGQAEKDKFDNALDSADAQIEQNEYGGQTLTVSDSTPPSSDSGTLKNLLGFLANRLKAITGKSDWKTSPKRTLEATGTISEQDYDSVNITGGSIVGITDLTITDGGTGASTASTARTNLGLGNVPNEDATNPANWDPTNTDGNFLVGDGTTFVVESGATARTSLGLGSISTQDASSVAITGGSISVGTIDVGDGTNYTEIKSDGEINLHGTARVTKELDFNAGAVKAPPTKSASWVDHGIVGAWEFSDGTDDTIVATMNLPRDMDLTVGPTIGLRWSSATTSGDVFWQLAYLYRGTDEDTTAAATGTLHRTGTSSATANGFTHTNFTMISAPAVVEGSKTLFIRVKRLGGDGDDTIGDTAELHSIIFGYTSDKLGIALLP